MKTKLGILIALLACGIGFYWFANAQFHAQIAEQLKPYTYERMEASLLNGEVTLHNAVEKDPIFGLTATMESMTIKGISPFEDLQKSLSIRVSNVQINLNNSNSPLLSILKAYRIDEIKGSGVIDYEFDGGELRLNQIKMNLENFGELDFSIALSGVAEKFLNGEFDFEKDEIDPQELEQVTLHEFSLSIIDGGLLDAVLVNLARQNGLDPTHFRTLLARQFDMAIQAAQTDKQKAQQQALKKFYTGESKKLSLKSEMEEPVEIAMLTTMGMQIFMERLNLSFSN